MPVSGGGFEQAFNAQAAVDTESMLVIAPLIAVAKEDRHPDWRERHSEPPALPENATPLQAMARRLKTKAGRAFYALRKQTVEPVFRIIKSVMGFRQFSPRGLT